MSTIRIRKKPITVSAVQWTGDNFDEVHAFVCAGTNWQDHDADESGCCWSFDTEGVAQVYDFLHEKDIPVKVGQWVIRGVKDEFYPCDDEVLAETYDRVNPLVEAANSAAEAGADLVEAFEKTRTNR